MTGRETDIFIRNAPGDVPFLSQPVHLGETQLRLVALAPGDIIPMVLLCNPNVPTGTHVKLRKLTVSGGVRVGLTRFHATWYACSSASTSSPSGLPRTRG